ncbi:hypothetical protein BKA82DRAFT_23672 [Pisolithus tinctorius]|uniref:Uncharacterized protein n=1 Tax=Pisolithus tinctorius Marx 270 TaxID=870435 RepID=A0A0C3JFM0_PISTI|nr:hypothetical protein BKA82DRAFT_23672 [Pisolithus tinctorius]KIO07863.1 hypothetical protein M404DRAFT_23672 [Pisolithus tinctorius Marx 270]
MDNPWANAWEQPLSNKPVSGQHTWASPSEAAHDQEADLGLPSWSLHDSAEWTSSVHAGDPLWYSSEVEEAAWAPSTYEQIVLSQPLAVRSSPSPQEEPSEPVLATLSSSPEVGCATSTPLPSEHSKPYSALLPSERDAAVPENDITGGIVPTPTALEADDESDTWEDPTLLAGPDDEWASAWSSAPPQGEPEEIQPPDEWETAQQAKEKFNRAVPPELLDAILRQCEQFSDVISPQPETVESNTSNDNWRNGPTGLENITMLLSELLSEDSSLPLPVQFPSTATAKAVNEALKLTRHLTLSGSSPLARLLASRGTADWQKSVVSREDVVPDVTPIGWRILDKGEHRGTVEETRPRKATGGLLSFWSRRTSAAPSPSDDNSETPASGRSSISSSMSANLSQPQAGRDVSPSKRSSTVTPAPAASQETASEVAVTTTAPAPSAVSRFLNRFARTKSTNANHASLALSADDLEYLSDINVPSATDPDDENDAANLKGLSNMINSSPLPEKLPPPLPPPPKPIINPSPLTRSNPSSSLVTPIPSPLTPQTNTPPANSSSPIVPTKYPSSVSSFVMSSIPAVSPALPTSSTPQPSPRAQSSFPLLPPPKAPTALSLPPLIPPPPTSPPQTPRPGTMQRLPPPMSTITPSSSSLWSDVAAVSDTCPRDSGDSDEFSFFSSGPLYRRSHVPSDSASVRSPESEDSLDRLRSPRSSISCSLDDFDDFVTSPSQDNTGLKTPSPPPVPAKNTPPSYRKPGLPLKHSVRSSDHMRTQSLMDQANATKGTWPSPRVEDVQARPIPPPPRSENLLDFEDTMSPSTPVFSRKPLIAGSSQLSATSPSHNSPLVTQAAGSHQSPLSPPSASPFQSAFISSPTSIAAKPRQPIQQMTSKPVQTGGLSAQDLSFFEGL